MQSRQKTIKRLWIGFEVSKMPAAVWGVCVCWCFLSTEAILLSIRYWLGCQPSSAEDLTAVPNAWPLRNGAKNWWQEAPKCKYHQDDVLDVWECTTVVNDYVLTLLPTINELYIIYCYVLLNLKSIMEYSRSVYVYVFIYTLLSEFIFVSMDALVDAGGDGPVIHFDINHQYIFYILKCIYTNLYLHHIYRIFQLFLNRTKSESF